MPVLVDTNVVVDALMPASPFHAASRDMLLDLAESERFVINQVIWSELAPMVEDEKQLDIVCEQLLLEKEPIDWQAAWLAGNAHAQYRRAGGARSRTLPDFMIGAHATVAGYRLATRDPNRYRTYFPELVIIVPEEG